MHPPCGPAHVADDGFAAREPSSPVQTRRALLFGGALAAAAAAARTALAGAGPRPAIDALVDRITFGATQAERAHAQQLGYSAYLDYQLDYSAIDNSDLEARLTPLTSLTMTPWQLAALADSSPNVLFSELMEATFLRAIYSRTQLHERVVEFWHDHFNISIFSGGAMKIVEDRDVIRPYALGQFSHLLFAIARNPAMIEYLDNNLNHVNHPNQNYARELLELHTLGVNGGYTEQDVREIARCFTGWNYYSAYSEPVATRLTFVFRANEHDNGPKVVLGNPLPPNGGINDGYQVLSILASHPATARRIAGKLCAWFWGENPPTAMIDAAASTYQSTNGDIAQIIRTIFSFDFTIAPPKFKRPFHHFMSALRQTSATVLSTSTLRAYTNQTGHLPFTWGPPNGFPDTFDAWSKLLLPRWNFVVMYCCAGIGGLTFDPLAFLATALTPADVLERIDQLLFAGRMPASEKAEILHFASTGFFGFDDLRKRETVALALASPAYQWY